MSLFRWFLVPMFAGLSACGSGTKPQSNGNLVLCDVVDTTTQIHLCIEYKLQSASAAKQEQASCTNNGGHIVGQCSTTDLLGTCSYVSSGIPRVVHTYKSDSATTESVSQLCQSENGKFTPP